MINESECIKAGLDPKKVASIARRISKAAKEASALGIIIFGGSGSGSLRFDDNKYSPHARVLVIANLDGGNWDGGDGACGLDEDGFLRGE